MRIEKCGFEKVAFIDVELAMIEICLPFDKILSYREMEIELQNNFPTRILGKDKLVPIPLFSFNTAEGRVHRIVVFFISKENSLEKKADRVLPLIAALTKTAENVMQKKDSGENLLFWKFHKGVFFALLFWEGRLVYLWREYCENLKVASARIEKIHFFLKDKSVLFKGVPFVVFEANQKEKTFLFKESAKDFFWRNVDLESSKFWKPLFKARMIKIVSLLIFLGTLFFALGFLKQAKEKTFFSIKENLAKELEIKQNAFQNEFQQWKENPWVKDFPFFPQELFSLVGFKGENFQRFRGERLQGKWKLLLEYSSENSFSEKFLKSTLEQAHLKNFRIQERTWKGENFETGILEGFYVP